MRHFGGSVSPRKKRATHKLAAGSTRLLELLRKHVCHMDTVTKTRLVDALQRQHDFYVNLLQQELVVELLESTTGDELRMLPGPKEAAGSPRKPQEAPGSPRKPQEAPGSSRKQQEAPGSPRKPQEAAGSSRKPQEAPGPRACLVGRAWHGSGAAEAHHACEKRMP